MRDSIVYSLQPIACGLWLQLCLTLTAPCAAREKDLAAAIDSAALRAHVTYLASDELEGRRDGEGARLARRYVAERLRAAGLEPAGEEGFFQDIRREPEGPVRGRNVLGLLRGSDPALKKELVIISAHHDHLGKRGEQIFNGADDDATGVAALIEIARVLRESKVALKRSALFISFDLEERRLEGSRYFVKHPTVPLADVALFINMDMLGRDMADMIQGFVFVLGAEYTPLLKGPAREASAGTGLKTGFVGTDIIGIRGDYGPFRDRKIPYLFFSTGEHPDYHRPTDTAYPKLHKNTQIVLRTLVACADLGERPTFSEPRPDLDEVMVLDDVLQQISGRVKDLKLEFQEQAMLALLRGSVTEILKRGAVTAAERQQLKAAVQQLLPRMRGW